MDGKGLSIAANHGNLLIWINAEGILIWSAPRN